ncbi:MAG: serine/threonine-protein kinase [Gallionella sp.]
MRNAMIQNLGRYEIIKEIGQGAMGVVYEAKDPLIDRIVAIKTMNLQELSPDKRKEYEARFYLEARSAGRLSHPNIVTIHDLGECGGVTYIAMELMEGRELQNLLKEGQYLSVKEALNIMIQVSTGLAYAHEHGIVHRDIKPSNIMVLKGNRVKIADFGIALMDSWRLNTQDGKLLGSPLYMSPEQVSSRSIDRRSDIFSAGTLLYRMLSGEMPFSGNNTHSIIYKIVNEEPQKPSSLNPDIPETLDQIVSKCLSKNPDDRYQNAFELEDDLRACQEMLLRANTGLDRIPVKPISKSKIRKLIYAGIIVLVIILFELVEEYFLN